MINYKYVDLIIDKGRTTVNLITILQAPIIFLIVAYLFNLKLDSSWIMVCAMVFLLYCILVLGRTFIYQINKVSRCIEEDLLGDDIFKLKIHNFIPWKKYYDSIRNKSYYSTIILLLLFVILRSLFSKHFKDIFLILFYIDGGIFFFIILNNVSKFTVNMHDIFSAFLNLKEMEKINNKLTKVRKQVSFLYVCIEALMVSLLYILILWKYWEMGIFQYIQYTIAFFVLYVATRLFISLRQYFQLNLQYIDRILDLTINAHDKKETKDL